MVGPKKQDFCPKVNVLKGIVFFKSADELKSAKIVLSKSIFDVKNQLNFFKKKNLGLGQIFYPKD